MFQYFNKVNYLKTTPYFWGYFYFAFTHYCLQYEKDKGKIAIMNTDLTLGIIYKALFRNKDYIRFAKWTKYDQRKLKMMFLDPSNAAIIIPLFLNWCAEMYIQGRPKAKPRGSWVSMRGKAGQLKSIQDLLQAENNWWGVKKDAK